MEDWDSLSTSERDGEFPGQESSYFQNHEEQTLAFRCYPENKEDPHPFHSWIFLLLSWFFYSTVKGYVNVQSILRCI